MIESLYFYGEAGEYLYEAERLIRCFLPAGKLAQYYNVPPRGNYAAFGIDENITVTVSDGKTVTLTERKPKTKEQTGLLLWQMIYKLMSRHTGTVLPWGILTGVRPVKVIKKIYGVYADSAAAERFMTEQLFISPEKLGTAKRIISAQSASDNAGKNTVSLYVSIPFCPTRCSYCSFISSSAGALKLKGEYLGLLLKELDIYREVIKDCSLELSTVYIGGGTPTVLEPDELERLMDKLAEFDLTRVGEFTVEAGRPDTVTAEKLWVLKRGGVSRISVNPQTFSDEVLRGIGRAHTAAQVYEAFYLARDVGFDNINMDIIAGLPGDDFYGFHDTVTKVCGLSPENVTVHTLSLKRSSTLFAEREKENIPGAAAMVDDAAKLLDSAGYHPYYLYRQKNIADNLENIGYCKAGRECLYNIYMMEELQSIIAAGCAASSKLIDGSGITRLVNYKYPYEYISRFDKMLDGRAERLRRFFARNG